MQMVEITILFVMVGFSIEIPSLNLIQDSLKLRSLTYLVVFGSLYDFNRLRNVKKY
jgi:hypothetical protein